MQTEKKPSNGQILFKAHELINGQRQKDYGAPSQNFEQIAEFWNTYLNRRCGLREFLTAYDVANLMMLLKIARTSVTGVTPTEDCYVDIAGYAGLANDFCEIEREMEMDFIHDATLKTDEHKESDRAAVERLLRDAARLDDEWNTSERRF